MKVLVACEYSGIVREAFASKGHDAWSCDLLPTDQPSDKHIQGDVLEIINNDWNLIIAHPPCTHLSVSGAARWAEKVAGQTHENERGKREDPSGCATARSDDRGVAEGTSRVVRR